MFYHFKRIAIISSFILLIVKYTVAQDKPKYDTFTGVVTESGAAIIDFDGSSSLGFTFFAYTKNGSEIIEKEIFISKKLPHMDYDISQIQELDVITIKGKQVKQDNQIKILLESIEEVNVEDKRFEQLKEKRLQPVNFQSKKLGIFTLERSLDWFVGQQKWLDQNIELMLIGKSQNPKKAEKVALSLFEKQKDWNQKFKQQIAQDLLALKNDTWLGDDEKPFSKQEFLKRIQVTSITVYENGTFEIWYDDGDTFWGHSILVRGNLKEGTKSAGIEG